MLTVALNEYGDFHHLGQDEESIKTIHFIAGIVYDDMDNEQDAENERIRLDRFFRAVAKDSHSLYPQGFLASSRLMKPKRKYSILMPKKICVSLEMPLMRHCLSF